jgi:hypothetical protein
VGGGHVRRIAAAALTAIVTVGLAAVDVASAQDADSAFCDAVLAAEAATDERPRELDRRLTRLSINAPFALSDTVLSLVETTRSAIETQSDPAQEPAVREAEMAVGAYAFDHCGWQTAEVTTTEYEFAGLPRRFTTGPAIIRVTNDGAEVHELAIVRLKGGEKVRRLIRHAGHQQLPRELSHDVVDPGATVYTIVDLRRTGRHAGLCFVPVGTTPEVVAASTGDDPHGGDPDAPSHATEGMHVTFEVTRD